MKRIFVIGRESLVRNYLEDNVELRALRFWNVLSVGPGDVVITARPWILLFELWCTRSSNRRPKLIQVADGLVFEANCRKAVNRRYEHLYSRILADEFWVRQNIEDLASLVDRYDSVRSVTTVSYESTTRTFSSPTVLLLAGNDPFLGTPSSKVLDSFISAYDRLFHLHNGRVLLSAPCPTFAKALCERRPAIRSIGRIADFEGPLDNTLFVGSPSTVLLERFIDGGFCVLLDLYKDSPQLHYFPRLSEVEIEHVSLREFRVSGNTVRLVDRQRIATKEVLSMNKNSCLRVGFLEFFRNFRWRLLARELQLLVLGATD